MTRLTFCPRCKLRRYTSVIAKNKIKKASDEYRTLIRQLFFIPIKTAAIITRCNVLESFQSHGLNTDDLCHKVVKEFFLFNLYNQSFQNQAEEKSNREYPKKRYSNDWMFARRNRSFLFPKKKKKSFSYLTLFIVVIIFKK